MPSPGHMPRTFTHSYLKLRVSVQGSKNIALVFLQTVALYLLVQSKKNTNLCSLNVVHHARHSLVTAGLLYSTA